MRLSLHPIQKLDSFLRKYPVRVLFLYSLFGELLVLLFLFLAFLWTAETVLPGFISLRLNLTWYLVLLLLLANGFILFGKHYAIRPIQSSRFTKSLLALIGLWSILIVSISLYHFPLWSIAAIIGTFLLLSLLAWKHFLRN